MQLLLKLTHCLSFRLLKLLTPKLLYTYIDLRYNAKKVCDKSASSRDGFVRLISQLIRNHRITNHITLFTRHLAIFAKCIHEVLTS